jgi:hypothetical protein
MGVWTFWDRGTAPEELNIYSYRCPNGHQLRRSGISGRIASREIPKLRMPMRCRSYGAAHEFGMASYKDCAPTERVFGRKMSTGRPVRTQPTFSDTPLK